jgi:uncharacterized protein YidB (DUF937 family)
MMGLLDNVLGSGVPGGKLAKPLGIALLALLASRMGQGGSGGGLGGLLGGGQAGAGQAGAGQGGGGGLGGLLAGGGLGGLLGGLLGGGNSAQAAEEQLGEQAPAAVSGGLGGLLRQFQQNGYGHVADSWIGHGPNQQIAPDQLHQALGPEVVDELSEHSGMPRQEVLSQLSQALPDMVDRLTPEGRIPDHAEVAGWQDNQRVDV